MSFDIAKAENFVAKAKLPPKPARKMGFAAAPAAPVFEAAQAQALVVGSDVVSFSEAVDADVRAAISDSALLAQLSANVQSPAEADPMAWFDAYFGILAQIGWVVQSNDAAEYEIKGSGLEVHEAIEEVLKLFLGPVPGAAALAMAALTGLKSMKKDSPLIALFNKQSQHAHVGRFHFTTVRKDPQHGLLVEIGAFALRADEKLTQILFFKMTKNKTKMHRRLAQFSLNEAALARLRPQIAQRVAAFQSSFVGSLPLPPLPSL
jgi:hypothetical protein